MGYEMRSAAFRGAHLLEAPRETFGDRIWKNKYAFWGLTAAFSVVCIGVGALLSSYASRKAKPSNDSAATAYEFSTFIVTHSKRYQSVDEYKQRMANWEANTKRIDEHNRKRSSYKFEVNKFADLTSEEFIKSLGYKKSTKSEALLEAAAHNAIGKPLPSFMDWVSLNCVTPVKDQGQCGSCWAFSVTGAIESARCIKNGTLPSLSEQELVDCSKDDGNDGCNGGTLEGGFQFVIDTHGLCNETSYPYQETEASCRSKNCTNSIAISSYQAVQPMNGTALEEAIAFVGPVSVAVDAEVFQFYSSGIIDENCGADLNHAVLVVGYGVDKTTGMQYWLVKNSWGVGWGEEGYVRIYRNKNTNMCGILMEPVYPVI